LNLPRYDGSIKIQGEAQHMKRRRSSSSITLVLVGASALSACGDSPQSTETMQRDMYASKADCIQDWGADPAKCEPAKSTSSTRTGSYWGPAYSRGAYGGSNSTHADGTTTSDSRPGSRAIGTAYVSRSGFGSSSSSHSSSSSSHASSSGS
jgi:uncharacterized protein YgiB involved in biofilm formation